MGTATTQSPTSVVPESHVWEAVVLRHTTYADRVFFLNKVTGEVRARVSDKSKGIKTLPLTN